MDRFGPAVRRKSGKRTMSVRFPARLMPNLSFSSKVVVYGHRLVALPLTVNETQKCPSLLPIFKQDHSGGDSVAIGVAAPFLHRLRSRSPSVPLWRQFGFKQV